MSWSTPPQVTPAQARALEAYNAEADCEGLTYGPSRQLAGGALRTYVLDQGSGLDAPGPVLERDGSTRFDAAYLGSWESLAEAHPDYYQEA